MLLSKGTKIESLYNNYNLDENAANSLNWVRLNNSILAKPNIAMIHTQTPKELLLEKLNEGLTQPVLQSELPQKQLTESLNVKNIIDTHILPNMTNKEIKDKILELINNASQISNQYERDLAFKSLKQLTALYLAGDVKKVLNDSPTLDDDIELIKAKLTLLAANTDALEDLRNIVKTGTIAPTPTAKVPLSPDEEAAIMRDIEAMVTTPAPKPARLFPETSSDEPSSSTTFETPSKGMKGLALNDKTKQDIIQKMNLYGIELLTSGRIYFEKYDSFDNETGAYPANTAFLQRGSLGLKTNRESINYVIKYNLKKGKNIIQCRCYGKDKNGVDKEDVVGVGYETFTREENLKNVLMITFIATSPIDVLKKMVRDNYFQGLCDLLILNNLEMTNEYTAAAPSAAPSEVAETTRTVGDSTTREAPPMSPLQSLASYFMGKKP